MDVSITSKWYSLISTINEYGEVVSVMPSVLRGECIREAGK